MNIRKTITSEIEWNTIKKAQADGKLQELLQVGDELDITLKTGEELTVQAVGTTEHGLIFLLKDCMKDEHGMNKRMTNKGGWRDSEMRLWLNETIIHMLPDELREMIVPRRIVQTMDGERLESEDKLWLPSFTEMFGKENAEDWAPADTDETQLELFSTERSRVKEKPGERYMVVLAPLSEWQRLHEFLQCQQRRHRRLRRRELCVWRGLRLLPLI